MNLGLIQVEVPKHLRVTPWSAEGMLSLWLCPHKSWQFSFVVLIPRLRCFYLFIHCKCSFESLSGYDSTLYPYMLISASGSLSYYTCILRQFVFSDIFLFLSLEMLSHLEHSIDRHLGQLAHSGIDTFLGLDSVQSLCECWFLFLEQGFVVYHGLTQAHCVAKEDSELPAFLSLPPDCWDYRPVRYTIATYTLWREPRASHTVGHRSTNWATSPAPFLT